MVEVRVIRQLDDLRIDHAVSVDLEPDRGHACIAVIEFGAKDGVGDIHDDREESESEALVSKEGDALLGRVDRDIASALEVVLVAK